MLPAHAPRTAPADKAPAALYHIRIPCYFFSVL
jgi:hypothetical protein